jgi:steroid delta-isomerase-like uncharacterized protein
MSVFTAREPGFDVESFMQEYYDAWSGTDEDLIMSYYAENVVLRIPGAVMEGKEAVRDQFVRPFITAFPGNRHHVHNVILAPCMVVAEWTFEALHKGPFGGHVATGARIKLPGCGVYEYDAVKRQITAGRIYFDVGTLLQIITDSLLDDRREVSDALRTTDRMSLITNAIPTFIHVLRGDGTVLYVNQAVLGYTGLTLEDARNADYRARLLHPDDLARLREEHQEALTRPVPFESEHRLLSKDGGYRWFLVRYNPLLDERGRIDRWYVAAFDIDDRKQAEAELEQAYLRLAEAQRLSRTGSFIADLSSDDHNWSEEALRIFEFDPATRLTLQMIRDRVNPDDLPSFDAVLARGITGTDVDFVFRIVTSRSALKHVRGIACVTEQIAGHPLLIGALQDVTESKLAEETMNRARSELAHMARVSTLNALTASIAHEINQPLAGIITNASTCLRMLDGDPPNIEGARETARRTIRDGHRASDVLSGLRALFSKKEYTLEPLDLNDATREVIALSLSDLQRNRVILRSELADDLPQVTGDRVQLQEVILNLLRNASDAMIAVDGRPRQMLIKTRREAGDRVCLSVRDSGTGLDPQHLDRLFEAFYTTKSGGMGIGLSVSRSIVERHHGRLWAEPNDGPGATFSFSIPRCSEGDAGAATQREPGSAASR